MFNTSFKGGLDLKFFENAEFESVDDVSKEDKPLIIGRNALRFLMMGGQSASIGLNSWPLFKAISIKRNASLVSAMRLAFQEGFEHLYMQLSELTLNEAQKEQVRLYLSNCLNLLPYADLTPYESIKIPQLINDKWALVDYSVTPIELTSTKDFHGYSIKDHDRVFAYGLQPIVNEEAQSHLIFMGTTYPAGQGFLPQLITDFKAFDHVGNHLYQSGRVKILHWLTEQRKKIHVCGVSLGGALSLLFAIDQGEHIDRVDALNPPGLANPTKENHYDYWDSLTIKPQVVIQLQGDDPISFFGEWKREWKLIRVQPPQDKRGPNPFYDHFLNYAGFGDTLFTYISADEENQKRKYRNLLIFNWGRGLFYFTAIWPYTFLLRPTLYFIFGLLAFFILPWFTKAEEKRVDVAKLHDPKLQRNPQLDIYHPDNTINISSNELTTYSQVISYLGTPKELITNEEIILSKERTQIQVSKAKAITIKRTLSLFYKFGTENPEELKKAVEEEYNRYSFGRQ